MAKASDRGRRRKGRLGLKTQGNEAQRVAEFHSPLLFWIDLGFISKQSVSLRVHVLI